MRRLKNNRLTINKLSKQLFEKDYDFELKNVALQKFE